MSTAGDPRLSVDIAPGHPIGLRLPNPVMIASGTFGWDGYGRGILSDGAFNLDMADLQGLGSVIAKTVTPELREPNPEPRWHPVSYTAAAAAGECVYLNSIGLANPGIRAALKEMAPHWASWRVPVLLSIAGRTPEEFGAMAAMAEGTPGVAGLELNLSCPNIEDGAHFSHSPEIAGDTVRHVVGSSSLPVIAKLSPNVPDIAPIAVAAAEAGASALALSNTLPAMAIDLDTGRPVLGGITGGLSGPGLHAVAVAMVYRAASAVNVPIIGVGGVFTCRDALEFIFAGATAVQVGSANLADFHAPVRVLDGLVEYLNTHEIGHISELVGFAHRQVVS